MPGASSWWLSTCPDLRAPGARLGKFWVSLPQRPSGLLLGCLVWGVLSSSIAIVSHVVTTDVATPEYDDDEGGSFGFEIGKVVQVKFSNDTDPLV